MMAWTIGKKMSRMAAMAGVACACTLPAVSQVGIYIGRTPPPLRYEVPPPTPGPDYLWNEGYWNWSNNQYVWVPGRWARPPYAGAYWEHPHYDHYDRGCQFHEGHWDHEDHVFHHYWDR